MNWEEIKNKGSLHYKTGEVEPIDLFKAGDILWDWCIGEIIAKAYRIHHNRPVIHDLAPYIAKDLDKIIHYAEMLKVVVEEESRKCRKAHL